MTAKDSLVTSLLRNSITTWKRFWADVSGAVLFYITATLPALVGFSLLAIDASRLMTLHTSLQKGVDALSLAAAGELDRTPNAMARAQLAAENLLRNTQVFGLGEAHIGADTDPDPVNVDLNVTLTFYSKLPASDSDPMPAGGPTKLDPTDPNDNARARFVRVTVDTYAMDTIFPASFLGGPDSATSNATAVAGMSQVLCRLTPLFICNPWEGGTNDIYENLSIYNNTNTRLKRRRQMRVRMGPGGSGWFPGNYGFLDFGNGAPALEKALAVGAPDNCFAQSGVDTKTGQNTGPVEDGINTRFGLYPSSLPKGIAKPYNQNWQVRPAKNIRMGQPQNASKICSEYSPDTNIANGMALPRDPVFANQAARLGSSAHPTVSEFTDYWNGNFAAYDNGLGPGWPSRPAASAVGPAITDPPYQAEGPAGLWSELTRYEMYKWEISTDMMSEVSGDTPANGGGEVGDPWEDPNNAETGGARCFKGTKDIMDPLDEVDRRLIGVAILNCKALEAHGFKLNGNTKGIPVASFAEFFLTEPLEKGGSGTAGDIYMEFVNIIEAGTEQSVSRDQVQIYR
ncbi:MAG: hypothetical protein HKN11_02675 [Rhizobiales bacterium]|nr:hypothetical protein [Hyphomicrobiales bacterium]